VCASPQNPAPETNGSTKALAPNATSASRGQTWLRCWDRFLNQIGRAEASRPTTTTIDKDLPRSAKTWAIKIDGVDLTYNQIHEMIHRDVGIGNDYRKERVKLLTTLAAGVFAITVTFHKDMFGSQITSLGLLLLVIGWLLLVASLLAGIYHFRAWEDFYLEHREVGNSLWHYHTAAADEDGRKAGRIDFHKARDKVQKLQQRYRIWNFIQTYGLIFGLVFIIGYVVVATRTCLKDPEACHYITSKNKIVANFDQ
jgi:hypothetical protein